MCFSVWSHFDINSSFFKTKIVWYDTDIYRFYFQHFHHLYFPTFISIISVCFILIHFRSSCRSYRHFHSWKWTVQPQFDWFPFEQFWIIRNKSSISWSFKAFKHRSYWQLLRYVHIQCFTLQHLHWNFVVTELRPWFG